MFDATQATSTMLRDMYQVTQNTINSQRETIDSLRIVNENICRNDTMGATISPELKVLFPEVADIAITRAITSNVETGQLDTLNIALVHYSRTMNLAQREKFTKYLEARLSTKSIRIVPTEY